MECRRQVPVRTRCRQPDAPHLPSGGRNRGPRVLERAGSARSVSSRRYRLGSWTGSDCPGRKELRVYVLDFRRRAIRWKGAQVPHIVLTCCGSPAYGSAWRLAMRRILVLAAVVVSALTQAVPLHACGDKLMMLGRGVRFQAKHTPRAAAVLLYLPESATGQALTDPKLESALREAGHAVRAVTSLPDLETALRSGTFDVVLANVTHAPELEKAKSVAERNAVVLPAIYLVVPSHSMTKQVSQADRDKASKDFGVIVDVPGRPGQYCHAVDQAMELKLKREKEAARRP